jgi:hypothetical protein
MEKKREEIKKMKKEIIKVNGKKIDDEVAKVRAILVKDIKKEKLLSDSGTLHNHIEESIKEALLSSVDERAWSAAFVTYVVRKAAIDCGLECVECDANSKPKHVGFDKLLASSPTHSTYVLRAYLNDEEDKRNKEGKPDTWYIYCLQAQ